jgi:hypothetical protein
MGSILSQKEPSDETGTIQLLDSPEIYPSRGEEREEPLGAR